MNAELQKAIVSAIKSDTTLHSHISDRVFYDLALSDTMPYITFTDVGAVRNGTFAASSSWDDHTVQFSIFDKRPSVVNIEAIHDALVSALDRKSLTFSDHRQVGCSFENKTGPSWVEDCWQTTADFTIGVQ